MYCKLIACISQPQRVLIEIATTPKSDRVSLSIASNTFFIVCHPDELEVSDHHERSPLITATKL